jgi:hypothetical protein
MKLRFLLLLGLVSQCLASSIQIQTTQIPNAILKDSYSAVISASGGCTPYKWQVSSGTLPTGVTMKTSSSTTSVTLSGKPSKAATYSFTLSATGCGGHAAKASYKVVVQSAADHTVDLSWSPSTTTDVTGYNVYRGPDGKSWTKLNTSLAASTYYNDSTVADSSTYYYATTAVDIKGKESDKSNIVTSTIP